MTTPRSRNAPCPCGSGRKYKNCCLPKDRRAADAEAERRGPLAVAAEHPWEAGIFPLPTGFDDQPGRRVSVALVTAGGLVLHHDMITDPLGRIDEVADALDAALEAVEKRTGVRPGSVGVRHRAVAQALKPRLAARGIAVEARHPLRGLDDAARSLCAHMLDLDVLPLTASAPTWRGWGLSTAQCRAFFFAAARFRRAAPWKRLGDEAIQVFGPHGAWTAAVMGSGGQEFGLTVYTDPHDYEVLFTDRFDPDTTLENMQGAMFSVSFEPRGDITREMQKEVAAAGWEVADPAGYPVIFTTNTPAGGLDPAVADLLAGILLAIPDFLDARADGIARGLAGQRIHWEHEATGLRLGYVVPGGFAWPVPDRLEPGGPEGAGARPEARIVGDLRADEDEVDDGDLGDGDLDDADADGTDLGDADRDDLFPDLATVDAFEAHLRESVSAATAARHARNAADLVEFVNGGQGAPLCALHEYDLRMFLYGDFPRARPGFGRTESLPGSLRKFFAFVGERQNLAFPWAEALLRDRRSLDDRVRTAPAGPWWLPDVRDFLADVWDDLDRRVMLLPPEWAGALEAEPFAGTREARLQEEAQRLWLVWRDALIRGGMDTPADLEDALGGRLLDWLDRPDPEDDAGRTRLAVIRAERDAVPPERREELRRAWRASGEA